MSSGLDLLAFLRRDPAFQAMPVIILTGYFLSTEEDAAIRHKGATVLYKPSDLRTISARLSALRQAADKSASTGATSWAG